MDMHEHHQLQVQTVNEVKHFEIISYKFSFLFISVSFDQRDGHTPTHPPTGVCSLINKFKIFS
jgi:hypothetical protein